MINRLFPFKNCKLKIWSKQILDKFLFRLFQFQKMQAQILLNGSPLITSSKSKHIALDNFRLFQFQKMQAQILLNGSPPLIASSKSKHIALDKLGIRSPDCVLSRTRSSFQGYYYYNYYKPLAGIRTRRVRGRAPRVRASSTANSNEEELENSAAAAAAGAEEVRVKIQVGQVGNCSESVYFFHKIFGASSSIVVVTLPKPLGIVFEESQWRDGNGKCRVVVAGLVPGGNADQASRVAKLFHGGSKLMRNQNQPVFDGDVRPGDILRATTTVGVIVDFLSIRRPQRVIAVYKVDGRPWHLIMRALNASFVADGDVTLVLERRL